MLVGKQKANFRIKITDTNTSRSKTLTVYEGKERKTLDQFYKELIQKLRTN